MLLATVRNCFDRTRGRFEHVAAGAQGFDLDPDGLLALMGDAYIDLLLARDGGREAKAILERARGQVAALLGAAPDEVDFTSGDSEANNLALKGGFFARRDRGTHIVTTAVEHPATWNPCGSSSGWAPA